MKKLWLLFFIMPALALAQNFNGPFAPLRSYVLPLGGSSYTLAQLTTNVPAYTVSAGTPAYVTDAGGEIVISNGTNWVEIGGGASSVTPSSVTTFTNKTYVAPVITGTATNSGTYFNNASITESGAFATANTAFYWLGSVTGTCTTTQPCPVNYFNGNFNVIANGSNPVENTRVYSNLGGSNMTGGFINFDSTLFFNASTSDSVSRSYQAGQVGFLANVPPSTLASGVNHLTDAFGNATDCQLAAGALYWVSCHGQETHIAIATGASADYLGGDSVILAASNAVAAAIDSFGFAVGSSSAGIGTLKTAYAIGLYQGYADVLASTGVVMRFVPHANAGAGPSIACGIDFAGLCNSGVGAAVFSGSAFSSPGHRIDGSGRILNSTAGGTVYLGADAAGVYNGLCVVPGATGVGTILQECGVDASRNIFLYAAGTANIFMGNTTNGNSVQVNNCAAACSSRLALTGGASGAGPQISVLTAATTANDFALTIAASASNTAAVAGGLATLQGGAGNTSGAGGAANINGGAGGTTGAGGNVNIKSGNGGATSGNSGNIVLTPGTVVSGTVGNVQVAGAFTVSGAVTFPGLASSSAATTGTLCWTTGTGNVNVDTTTTCLLSDGRLKMNVEPLDAGLDEVMQLRPVSYDLKPEVNPTGLGRQVGLIAQDVMAVDPRLAATYQTGPDEGTPSGVRYEQMVALLVKAIQEQQAEIDDLKRQVQAVH